MSDDEELFTHEVTAWTVGDLRRALEGIPDELLLLVFLAEEPGGDTVDEQVVYGAAPWNRTSGADGPPEYFTLECEFPPGRYYRRTR